MLDGAALNFAEAIAAIVGLGLLAIAALAYMRAVNVLIAFLRQRGYTDYGVRRSLDHDPRYFSDRLISRACPGVGIADIPDPDYRQLLLAVRKPLLACLVLFMSLTIGLGWITRDTTYWDQLGKVEAEYKALTGRAEAMRRAGVANGQNGLILGPAGQPSPGPITLPQGPRMGIPPDSSPTAPSKFDVAPNAHR